MTSFEGKSAVVTGGTRGIGLAIVKALAERRCRVLLCARNGEDVGRTVSSLSASYGTSVIGTVCDVRSYAQVGAMIREAGRTFGGLDVLVNNAGIGSHNFVENMPVEEWSATVETNLSGVFYCCREAIPLMKRRGA